MQNQRLINVVKSVAARWCRRDFYVRIDLTDVVGLDDFYGDGSSRHADLLLQRAMRKFCADGARLVQDGPLEYVAIVRTTSETEAQAFAACVYDEFMSLMYDAGYECTVRHLSVPA